MLPAVMSVPMTWRLLARRSAASCFLFSSGSQPKLKIALHSCYCAHILFICTFPLNMCKTLFLYTIQGKWKHFLNRRRATDLFPAQSIKKHCLGEFHSRAKTHRNWRGISILSTTPDRQSATGQQNIACPQNFISVHVLSLKKDQEAIKFVSF